MDPRDEMMDAIRHHPIEAHRLHSNLSAQTVQMMSEAHPEDGPHHFATLASMLALLPAVDLAVEVGVGVD